MRWPRTTDVPNTVAGEPPAPPNWHALTSDAVLHALDTSDSGLSNHTAGTRLGHYGRNTLPAAPRKTSLQRLIEQFDNLLIYVLLGSAVITALLGNAVDTGVILGVVVLNAIIGVVQQGKAETALDAIRGMISARASVLRDCIRVTIDAADVVPGDSCCSRPAIALLPT